MYILSILTPAEVLVPARVRGRNGIVQTACEVLFWVKQAAQISKAWQSGLRNNKSKGFRGPGRATTLGVMSRVSLACPLLCFVICKYRGGNTARADSQGYCENQMNFHVSIYLLYWYMLYRPYTLLSRYLVREEKTQKTQRCYICNAFGR